MNRVWTWLKTASPVEFISVVAAAIILVLSWQLHKAHAEQERLALAESNARAAADVTRQVSAKAQKVLGDSLAAVERLVVQKEIKQDALDVVLNRVAVLTTRLDATIASLNVKNRPGTTVVVDSKDVRSSTFKVDSTPYHVVASVRMPPPPAPGAIDLAVRMDTIFMRPRLQCGPAVNGIHPATILVETPTWLTNARITDSQVSPSACNPQIVAQKRDWSPWWLAPVAFVGGVAWEATRK